MTTHANPPQVRDNRTLALVSALVDHGLVEVHRRDEAVAVVDGVLGAQSLPAAPLRRRLAELAGYLGGALVIAAGSIFLATEWAALSRGEQVGLLAGIAVLLAGAGAAIVAAGGGRRVLQADDQAVRRRLAGVLLTGAAVAASCAVGVRLEQAELAGEATEPLLVAVTMLVLALLGYLVAPTVVGQLGAAVGAVSAVPFLGDLVADGEPVPVGMTLLAVGVVWLLLTERDVWREAATGRVVGCVIVLAGAQFPMLGADREWVSYLATALVAVAAFGLALARPSWPYLATGVVGVTLAVPEALIDWTDGSLGPAGVLLVAGVTLLLASLLGLRLRQEAGEVAHPVP